MTTADINELVDRKLSSFNNLLGQAIIERNDLKRRIEELEKKVKVLEEEKEDLKHQVENQSLNIEHLENEVNKPEQENEKRISMLEITKTDKQTNFAEDQKHKKTDDKIAENWVNGLGHFYGCDSSPTRRCHDKSAVSKVLKAMEAGQTRFNLKEVVQF